MSNCLFLSFSGQNMESSPESRIIVIIPAFNEASGIAQVVSNVRNRYPKNTVLVIDDCSTDDTAKQAQSAGAVVLRHSFNMGYGTTIQTGYKYAYRNGYDFLVQIDGDGQHEAEDIGRLLAALQQPNGPDIVIGSRFLGGGSYRPSTLRAMGIQFFRTTLKLFIKRKVSDPTSGFQAMNRKVLKVFIQDFFPVDYPDADVMVLLEKLNFRVEELPVRMYPNREGKSMHSNPFNVIYYVFKMIVSMVLTKVRKIEIY